MLQELLGKIVLIVPMNLVVQDGQHLIRMGEEGNKLYLIRTGRICVVKPAGHSGGQAVTLAILGRGHFVGERTLVTGRASQAPFPVVACQTCAGTGTESSRAFLTNIVVSSLG